MKRRAKSRRTSNAPGSYSAHCWTARSWSSLTLGAPGMKNPVRVWTALILTLSPGRGNGRGTLLNRPEPQNLSQRPSGFSLSPGAGERRGDAGDPPGTSELAPAPEGFPPPPGGEGGGEGERKLRVNVELQED